MRWGPPGNDRKAKTGEIKEMPDIGNLSCPEDRFHSLKVELAEEISPHRQACDTLRGTGGGMAGDENEPWKGLTGSKVAPISADLTKCASGWKEIEFEVMRDSGIALRSAAENADPAGVHRRQLVVALP